MSSPPNPNPDPSPEEEKIAALITTNCFLDRAGWSATPHRLRISEMETNALL